MSFLFKKLRIEELLALLTFSIISTLAFIGRKPLLENIQKSYQTIPYILFLAVFFIGYVLIIHLNRKKGVDISQKFKPLELLRDWLPIVVVVVIYESLKHLHLDDISTYLGITAKDQLMLNLDQMLFGQTPSLIFERLLNDPLTLISQGAYSMYYFYLPIFGMVLYVKGKKNEFREVSFTFILIAYAGYITYILVPVAGPEFNNIVVYNQDLYIYGRNAVMTSIDLARFDMDCFPSLHTAQPLAILFLAYKYEKKMFYIFLIPVILTIFSTMYLRYHYGVDVIAGIFYAIVLTIIGPKIFRYYFNHFETQNTKIESKKEGIA